MKLVEIYEIDTTSGLSGVLLRDPSTLDIISTFETKDRYSGNEMEDHELIIHDDVIYILRKAVDLVSPFYGTPPQESEIIQLNKYDHNGNELGARDWNLHTSQYNKGLEIFGFNILNDGDEDIFQEIFLQFVEANDKTIYSKMGTTTVGYNTNSFIPSEEFNGQYGFSNEITPLLQSGFVVNNSSIYQNENIIGNLQDKNVEIYVKNSNSSNFENTISYLNGNNFIPIGFDNSQIIGDNS